jgi:predicted enzyme related to lactoylglutathione lyase
MPKVTHFEILGRDGAKLQQFYASLFGWTIDANNPMNYGIVAPTENGIGGGITDSQDGKPMTTIYVEVDDVQAYLDKAKAAGAKVTMEKTVLPGMVTFAQFEDPAGNIIGLAETGVPPA